MNVSSAKPKATLTADMTAVPVGGHVTLTCSVRPASTGWKFSWFKDDKDLTVEETVSHLNEQISVSQKGLYSCRGGRGNPIYYTEKSPEVRIDATVSNSVKVILQPYWSEFYEGEKISVRCEIHGGDTEWDYEWDTTSSLKPSNQLEYSISSASSSHRGDYRCKGKEKSDQHKTTSWSPSVRLMVSDRPRSFLTVSPSWLSPGVPATLKCDIKNPSQGWRFYWYKAVPHVSNRYINNHQLLPSGVSGTAQDSYIIHRQTHTAGYICRAGRGDPMIYAGYSEPKFVWSGDFPSEGSLRVNPDRGQHFTSESITLTCDGNSTEWRVRSFSEDGPLQCPSVGTMTRFTCDISRLKSKNAVFWCESASGEFSNAVNITGQADDDGIILVSPVHPVTEGTSVILSCSLREQKLLSNVFFYRNDKLIQNGSGGELNISSVSKSNEGFYKCQHSRQMSPRSWMSVKGVLRPRSSSYPVFLIVGSVFGIILVITALLILMYCFRKSKGSAADQVVSHYGNQQKTYSSLHYGNQRNPGVNPCRHGESMQTPHRSLFVGAGIEPRIPRPRLTIVPMTQSEALRTLTVPNKKFSLLMLQLMFILMLSSQQDNRLSQGRVLSMTLFKTNNRMAALKRSSV
ncbi:Fc receptor-like protein 5 isoform 2-T2 [Pholidichthys leucotaenia]